jgi:hypothetical protein
VISPDGAYLAYSDPTGAYLKQIATGETHRLALPQGVGGPSCCVVPGQQSFLAAMVYSGGRAP